MVLELSLYELSHKSWHAELHEVAPNSMTTCLQKWRHKTVCIASMDL